MIPHPIRIALVDDQQASLDRFNELISFFQDFRVLWKANSVAEALRKTERDVPDVFLLDLEMPEQNGVDLCRELRARKIESQILMLSISDQNDHLKQALQAGANGYILKGERPEVLLQMVKDSLEGRLAFSAEMAKQTMELVQEPLSHSSKTPEEYNLSKRELDVLKLLVAGDTYTEIADFLVISPLTVRSHMENIYRKLQVQNKANAINIALKNRWF